MGRWGGLEFEGTFFLLIYVERVLNTLVVDRQEKAEDTDIKGIADGVRSPRRPRGLTSRALS